MVDIESYSNELIKNIFEKQRRELTESLQYASYIQKALLPGEPDLKKFFPEHFLFYLPRDLVSGDFYWFSSKHFKKKSYTFFVIIDCTGHGVPGALMSMIGNSILNEIIFPAPKEFLSLKTKASLPNFSFLR